MTAAVTSEMRISELKFQNLKREIQKEGVSKAKKNNYYMHQSGLYLFERAPRNNCRV